MLKHKNQGELDYNRATHYSEVEKMKKMITQARQGDVHIINKKDTHLRADTKARLFGIKKLNKMDYTIENRLPLAYGEVSGHAHAVKDPDAQLYYSSDIQESQKFLNASANTIVTHEEHDAIHIAEGDNAVLLQNEFKTKIERAAD